MRRSQVEGARTELKGDKKIAKDELQATEIKAVENRRQPSELTEAGRQTVTGRITTVGRSWLGEGGGAWSVSAEETHSRIRTRIAENVAV